MMELEVIPLSEGYFTVGFDKVFIPFDKTSDRLEDRSQGSLLVEIQPFLVRLGDENILFDTGLGLKDTTGNDMLDQNLKRNGLDKTDIHKVILSHLHKDHAGGISFVNEKGERVLRFPHARYYVSKNEMDYALGRGSSSYVREDFELLRSSSALVYLSSEGTIGQCINYWQDGGHCPYHTSFKIHLDDQIYFFGGDVAPQLRQLQVRYIAKYDFDGRKSLENRDVYVKKGKEEGWNFMFYHDVHTPIARL